MKVIILTNKIGNAQKGDVYIEGLHGVPEHHKDGKTLPKDWYWQQDIPKRECKFLSIKSIGKKYKLSKK